MINSNAQPAQPAQPGQQIITAEKFAELYSLTARPLHQLIKYTTKNSSMSEFRERVNAAPVVIENKIPIPKFTSNIQVADNDTGILYKVSVKLVPKNYDLGTSFDGIPPGPLQKIRDVNAYLIQACGVVLMKLTSIHPAFIRLKIINEKDYSNITIRCDDTTTLYLDPAVDFRLGFDIDKSNKLPTKS